MRGSNVLPFATNTRAGRTRWPVPPRSVLPSCSCGEPALTALCRVRPPVRRVAVAGSRSLRRDCRRTRHATACLHSRRRHARRCARPRRAPRRSSATLRAWPSRSISPLSSARAARRASSPPRASSPAPPSPSAHCCVGHVGHLEPAAALLSATPATLLRRERPRRATCETRCPLALAPLSAARAPRAATENCAPELRLNGVGVEPEQRRGRDGLARVLDGVVGNREHVPALRRSAPAPRRSCRA